MPSVFRITSYNVCYTKLLRFQSLGQLLATTIQLQPDTEVVQLSAQLLNFLGHLQTLLRQLRLLLRTEQHHLAELSS